MENIKYVDSKSLRVPAEDSSSSEKAHKKSRIVYVYSSTAGFTPDQARTRPGSTPTPTDKSSDDNDEDNDDRDDPDQLEAESEASDSEASLRASSASVDTPREVTVTALDSTDEIYADLPPILGASKPSNLISSSGTIDMGQFGRVTRTGGLFAHEKMSSGTVYAVYGQSYNAAKQSYAAKETFEYSTYRSDPDGSQDNPSSSPGSRAKRYNAYDTNLAGEPERDMAQTYTVPEHPDYASYDYQLIVSAPVADWMSVFQDLMKKRLHSSSSALNEAFTLSPINHEQKVMKYALISDLLSSLVKEEKVTREKMVGDLPYLLDKIQDDLHTRNPDPDAMLFAKSYLAKILQESLPEHVRPPWEETVKRIVTARVRADNVDAGYNPGLIGGTAGQQLPKYLAMEQIVNTELKRLLNSRTNWNEKFQEILAMPEGDPAQALTKHKLLSQIANDFVYTAKTYGTVIISELLMPVSMKTIKPVNVGGIAGGTKFIVAGILFKLATDEYGLYDGFEGAIKVAGHDLKGLTSYFATHVPGLHVPLACLIDYRGFRIFATSFLPLADNSLKYGSNDYGRTAHADDPELNKKMKKAAGLMNIKGHKVGTTDVTLYGPGDIEGHLGHDGRYYVLDFSRTFPPAPDGVGKTAPGKGAYLYRLLRPELVQKNDAPLSSDAFTRFGTDNHKEHNAEVRKAWKTLVEVLIPQFAKEWDKIFISNDTRRLKYFQQNLPSYLHRAGINLRLMGYVRASAKSSEFRAALLVEMIARCVKKEFEAILRVEMKSLGFPGEEPYRVAVRSHYNLVFGSRQYQASSVEYWNRLKKGINLKFPLALDEEELSPSYDLKANVDMLSLLGRVQLLTGAVFTPEAQQSLEEDPATFEVLDTDILELRPIVKQMNISLLSSAIAISLQAKQQSADRLFRVAYKKFADASLASGDAMAFYHWADTYLSQARLMTDPSKKAYLLRNACDNFKTAHSLRRKDLTFMSTLVSTYLELVDVVSKAESIHFLFEVIEVYAKRYSHLSAIKGDPMAKKILVKVSEVIKRLLALYAEHSWEYDRMDKAIQNLAVISCGGAKVPIDVVRESLQLIAVVFSKCEIDATIRSETRLFPKIRKDRVAQFYWNVDLSPALAAQWKDQVGLYCLDKAAANEFFNFISQMDQKANYLRIAQIQCRFRDHDIPQNQSLLINALLGHLTLNHKMDDDGNIYRFYDAKSEKIRLTRLDADGLTRLIAYFDLLVALISGNSYCCWRVVEELGFKPERIRKTLSLEGLSERLRASLLGVCNNLQEYYLKNGPKSVFVFQKSDLETPLDHRIWPKMDPNRPGIIQSQIDLEVKRLSDSNPSIAIASVHSPSMVSTISSKASDLGKGIERSGKDFLGKVSDSKVFGSLTPSLSVKNRHDKNDAISPRHTISRSASIALESASRSAPSLSGSGSSTEFADRSFMSPLQVGNIGIFKTLLDTLPMTHEAFVSCSKPLLIEGLRYLRTRISVSNVEDEAKRAIYDWLFAVPFEYNQIKFSDDEEVRFQVAYVDLLKEFTDRFVLHEAIRDFFTTREGVWSWNDGEKWIEYDSVDQQRYELAYRRGDENVVNLSRHLRRTAFTVQFKPKLLLIDNKRGREYGLRRLHLQSTVALHHASMLQFLSTWSVSDRLFQNPDLASMLVSWVHSIGKQSDHLIHKTLELAKIYSCDSKFAILTILSRSEFVKDDQKGVLDKLVAFDQLIRGFNCLPNVGTDTIESIASTTVALLALADDHPELVLRLSVPLRLPQTLVACLLHISSQVPNLSSSSRDLSSSIASASRKIVRLLASVLDDDSLSEEFDNIIFCSLMAKSTAVARSMVEELLLPKYLERPELIEFIPRKSLKLLTVAVFEIFSSLPTKMLILIGQLLSPTCPLSPKTREFISALAEKYLPQSLVTNTTANKSKKSLRSSLSASEKMPGRQRVKLHMEVNAKALLANLVQGFEHNSHQPDDQLIALVKVALQRGSVGIRVRRECLELLSIYLRSFENKFDESLRDEIFVKLGVHQYVLKYLRDPYEVAIPVVELFSNMAESHSWAVSTEEEIAAIVMTNIVLYPGKTPTLTSNAMVIKSVQKHLITTNPFGLTDAGRVFLADCIQFVSDRVNELRNYGVIRDDLDVFLDNLIDLRPRAAHCPEETLGDQLSTLLLEYFRELVRATKNLIQCPHLLATAVLNCADEEFGQAQRKQGGAFVMPSDDLELIYSIYTSSAMESEGDSRYMRAAALQCLVRDFEVESIITKLRVRPDFYDTLKWNVALLNKAKLDPIDLRLAVLSYRFFDEAALEVADPLFDDALAECEKIWAKNKQFIAMLELGGYFTRTVTTAANEVLQLASSLSRGDMSRASRATKRLTNMLPFVGKK